MLFAQDIPITEQQKSQLINSIQGQNTDKLTCSVVFENLVPPPKELLKNHLDINTDLYILSSDKEEDFSKLPATNIPDGHLLTILSDSCLVYYLSLPKILSEFLHQYHLEDEQTSIYLRLLLDEAIKNAIEHGNLELSVVKDGFIEGTEDFEDYLAIVQDRLMDPRWGKKKVSLQVTLKDNKLTCSIEDEGMGFDWEKVLESSEAIHHGRGIMLLKQIAEDIRFENDGRKHSFTIKLNPKEATE